MIRRVEPPRRPSRTVGRGPQSTWAATSPTPTAEMTITTTPTTSHARDLGASAGGPHGGDGCDGGALEPDHDAIGGRGCEVGA